MIVNVLLVLLMFISPWDPAEPIAIYSQDFEAQYQDIVYQPFSFHDDDYHPAIGYEHDTPDLTWLSIIGPGLILMDTTSSGVDVAFKVRVNFTSGFTSTTFSRNDVPLLADDTNPGNGISYVYVN